MEPETSGAEPEPRPSRAEPRPAPSPDTTQTLPTEHTDEPTEDKGNTSATEGSAVATAGGVKTRKSRQDRKLRYSRKDPGSVMRREMAARCRAAFRNRANSFPTISKFFLPRRTRKESLFIPPTKFLLGGNISDPLNLNSLKDEDVNRAMNAVTPHSSPLPTPPRYRAKIDVIIPPDSRDPLNLMQSLAEDEFEKILVSQHARRTRKRGKTRRRASESAASPPRAARPPRLSSPLAATAVPLQRTDTSAPRGTKRTASESEGSAPKNKDVKKVRRMDSLNKIVSPVVPQPGAMKRPRLLPRPPPRLPPQERPMSPGKGPTDEDAPKKLPTFHAKNKKFQYGNYDRYYGYRNLNAMMDVRLQVFEMHRHLFNNKDVLDIGCNVGHISIAASRSLGARSVTGIDIDDTLIARARKNLKTFVSVPPEVLTSQEKTAAGCTKCGASKCEDCRAAGAQAGSGKKTGKRPRRPRKKWKTQQQEPGKFYFPVSFSFLYGPIEVPGTEPQRGFPFNVTFKQANYVLKDEALLGAESPQYDLILCLSTSKWIHLNWGDAGLKLAFRRMFAELRPGGKLVLEAQNWASYKKKKRLTPTIYENFKHIEFFPNKFREYLLSPEVGFSKCSMLGVPRHANKGFRRPVQLYIKGDFTPSKAQWSDAYAPPSSHHRPDATGPRRRTVYAAALSPSPRPPSCGATAYSPPETSPFRSTTTPFYSPAADSYAPSYKQDAGKQNVYTTLGSPVADSPTASPAGHAPSPAAPFLEPSPGHSHAYTPSHASSASTAPLRRHKYALRSPLPLSSPAPDDSSLD